MFKQVKWLSFITILFLLTACIPISQIFPRKAAPDYATLPPEFFEHCKRIAVQEFYFAEGLETNAFSPTDSSFLRSVVEAKIVQSSPVEVVPREDQELLLEEMEYKNGKIEDNDDSDAETEQKLRQTLGADAFVHGIIYEYVQTPTKLKMTVAIKVVGTEGGRLWQSEIIKVEGRNDKYELFEKLGTILAQKLGKPKQNSQTGLQIK